MYGDDEKRLIEKNAPALQSLFRSYMDTHEARLQAMLSDLLTLRPLSELHEDDGPVLLWRVPVDEPPHVGSVCDSDWSHLQTYYTHWSRLPRVREPGEG